MKSLLGKVGGNLGYILLIMVVLSLISCIDQFKNQVTVYSVSKTDIGLLPLNPTIYKVFPESQVVIYWIPDSNSPVEKLVNCVVRDRLNWSGEFKDGSGKFMMVKGEFFQTFPVDKDIHYISKWKWWILKLWWMFK